ncbi:TetR/AcrR family transcriptional regulator [Hyphomicrobium sp.]|uniref:TetR/AcrR family transcriptional regulator n=1 Tax=Hyphomicrobium sp. TaxID=82 RepID=UPI001D6A0223|nr:TetR/AcrR family transcriptional regulator [Hyphomicrobium sp.]MBY0561018.1 TetR/AcrR family transcriptional regulator [Hyphomicrobium sp.]
MQEKSNRPYHHGDLRRTVIETAQQMLQEEKGWQFTLREVARRAGVSHAAPYKHFPDKSALLAELAALGFDQLRSEIAGALERPLRSARAEFVAAAKTYVQFGTANPSLYRLMFSGDVDKAAHVKLDEAGAGAFAELTGIIERGQASGAFKKHPVRGQAAAAWALAHGFTMLTIDGQLMAEKVGAKPLDAALMSMLEGLET